MNNERLQVGYIEATNGLIVRGSDVLLVGYTVQTTGNQLIGGNKEFSSRPTVNGSGVFLQGETFISPNIVYTTGSQTIIGSKDFTSRPSVNNSGVLLVGEDPTSVFNTNRPIKALPVVSTTYSSNSITGFLERMFFPFISGSVSLNSFAVRTYGVDTISAIAFPGGSYSSNDNGITGIAYANNTQLLSVPTSLSVGPNTNANYNATPSPFLLGVSLTSSSAEIYRTRIYVTGTNGVGTIDSSPRRIRFEPPYFYGVSSVPNLGIALFTSISNLLRVDPSSNPNFYTYPFEGKPSSIRHQFSPNGQYIYIAYPAPLSITENINSWGTITSIIEDQTKFPYLSEFTEQTPQTLSLGLSKSLRYRIYRSNNLLTVPPGQFFDFIFNLT